MSSTAVKTNGPKTSGKSWLHYYFRTFTISCWFSYDKMQAISALFTLAPIIKANARNKEEIIAACKTNVQFFNTQPFMANFIFGVCMAMIENHEPEEAIQAIKVGLMGPFAGIGDSLLWFTVRPIVFSIGAGLALQGNAFGPIFSLLSFWFVGQYVVRYLGMKLGYEQGTRFIEEFAESGLMEEVTNAISIVGITVVGTLIATWVRASSPLVFEAGEGAGMAIQPMLDMLMPKLLPALLTALAYWMLEKRKIHPVAVIFIFLGLGIVGSYVGIL
jgi:mannose/fructose/N-acetylgalactosamine-specific phosphotransferase system component IID